jgi:hypothetical protein
MPIHTDTNVHEAIRDHAAKARVQERSFGFSLGKFGIGYSSQRVDFRPEDAESGKDFSAGRDGDFSAELLRAMRRGYGHGRLRFDPSAAGRLAGVTAKAAMRAYTKSLQLAACPPGPGRLIAVC